MNKKRALGICLFVAFIGLLSIKEKAVFFVESAILATMAMLSVLKAKQQYSNQKISLLALRSGIAFTAIMTLIVIYLLYNKFYL